MLVQKGDQRPQGEDKAVTQTTGFLSFRGLSAHQRSESLVIPFS